MTQAPPKKKETYITMGVLRILLVEAKRLADKIFFRKTNPDVKLELEQNNFLPIEILDIKSVLPRETISIRCGTRSLNFKMSTPWATWSSCYRYLTRILVPKMTSAANARSNSEGKDYLKNSHTSKKTIAWKFLQRNAEIVIEASYIRRVPVLSGARCDIHARACRF